MGSQFGVRRLHGEADILDPESLERVGGNFLMEELIKARVASVHVIAFSLESTRNNCSCVVSAVRAMIERKPCGRYIGQYLDIMCTTMVPSAFPLSASSDFDVSICLEQAFHPSTL